MASRAKSGRRRSSCMVCRHIRIWESAWRSYARLNREYDLIKRVCACVGGSYLYSHSAGHLTYRDNLWFGVFALRAMCVILQRQSQTIPYGRDQQGRMTLAAARLIWVAPLEFIGLRAVCVQLAVRHELPAGLRELPHGHGPGARRLHLRPEVGRGRCDAWRREVARWR